MYITGMTHRDELFDLAVRWLNDSPAPGDGMMASRIVLYESIIIIVAVVVDRMNLLLQKVFGFSLYMENIRQKHLLRERILQYLPHRNRRTRRFAKHFHENPEYFFPHVPIDAAVFTCESRLLAIRRIKRLIRVAEKTAFRLADALAGEIRSAAQQVAGQRAESAGLMFAPAVGLSETGEPAQRDLREAEQIVVYRAAPAVVVTELPVKTYGRYLPDSMITAKCAFFGNTMGNTLVNAYCLHPDDPHKFRHI